jgi:apolipoprotein D and lipocalin family protein
MKIIWICSILSVILLPLASLGRDQPLETVKQVDLRRYAGKWYEIAAFPQRFQKGCTCTTAEYEMTDQGWIRVINTCHKDSPEGKLSVARGKAFIVPGSGNAKLRVQFFWPFRGDYWIIDLAEDYSYAPTPWWEIKAATTFGFYPEPRSWTKPSIRISWSAAARKVSTRTA